MFLPYGIKPYANTKELNTLLLEKLKTASQSILFVSGEFFNHVFNNPEIIEVLEEKANQRPKLSIDLIGGPNLDPLNEKLQKLIDSGKINYYQLPRRPLRHFSIIDAQEVRIENPHATNAINRRGYFLHSDSLGQDLYDGALKLMEISKKYQPKKSKTIKAED